MEVGGCGPGWNAGAMRNLGLDPVRKTAVFVERVKAMQALWTQDEAEFHGRHVDFERVWMWPKPVQRPHPPILVGGYGQGMLDRVVEFGDGWLASGLHLIFVCSAVIMSLGVLLHVALRSEPLRTRTVEAELIGQA